MAEKLHVYRSLQVLNADYRTTVRPLKGSYPLPSQLWGIYRNGRFAEILLAPRLLGMRQLSLILPRDVLSGMIYAAILKVANNLLGVLLQHRHVLTRFSA